MRYPAATRLLYPFLYLFLPSGRIVLRPVITPPPFYLSDTLSSPEFRAFIFLHLPFPFHDPFSLFNMAFLALPPSDPLFSCSSSSFGFARLFLRGSVQQGRVTFLGCLLHMVHIPAGLLWGPALFYGGPAGTGTDAGSDTGMPRH